MIIKIFYKFKKLLLKSKFLKKNTNKIEKIKLIIKTI